MKKIFVAYCFIIIAVSAFSQNNEVRTFVLEINNVTSNGGTVYISVSLNETSYRRQIPDYIFQIDSSSSIIRTELTLPLGECVINVFQDLNSNRICDSGIFGIPKEPVGITNWNGRGPPGNFNKHKINVNNTIQTVSVTLYQL